MREVDDWTQGGLYLGKSLAYDVDLTRIHKVVERTVRGLFYHESRRRLADGYGVEVRCNDSLADAPAEYLAEFCETICDPLSQIPPTVIGNDIFSYRFVITRENPDVSVWGLIFYGNVPFVALTGPES